MTDCGWACPCVGLLLAATAAVRSRLHRLCPVQSRAFHHRQLFPAVVTEQFEFLHHWFVQFVIAVWNGVEDLKLGF